MRVGWLAPVLAVALAGCGGSDVDPKRDLQVSDLTTGWFDAGIVEGGMNKLVPTIAFRLKNVSSSSIDTVQVNSVFLLVSGAEKELGSASARAVDARGLGAGDATSPIVLRAHRGYTGAQPRSEMLQHRLFVDATVNLFVKHRAGGWVKLGDYPIRRTLLTQ